MITSYVPATTHIIQIMFGDCQHSNLDKNRMYCPDCNYFVKEEEMDRIADLEDALACNHLAVCGGYYIGRLLNFITKNTEYLNINTASGGKWYNFCMMIDDEYTENGAIYHSDSTHNFAYQIAWLAEILYRRFLSVGFTEEEVRRMINDS